MRTRQRASEIRKAQAASPSETSTSRRRRPRKHAQPADTIVPRQVRFNVPGHPRHGVVVDLVAEIDHFMWRSWDLGRKLVVVLPAPESFRILLNPSEIEELT